MTPIRVLVVRDSGSTTTLTPTMLSLMIALLVLFIFAVLLVGGLFIMRSIRKSRKRNMMRGYYDEETSSRSTRGSTLRGLTITPSAGRRTPSIVVQEKQNLIDHSCSPPTSPIPEIRITFPEELDDQGKRQSGRVVVVKVGEHTIGLEPVRDDHLPPYQRKEGGDEGRFQSLDLDRIGGLKEKEPVQTERRWA